LVFLRATTEVKKNKSFKENCEEVRRTGERERSVGKWSVWAKSRTELGRSGEVANGILGAKIKKNAESRREKSPVDAESAGFLTFGANFSRNGTDDGA